MNMVVAGNVYNIFIGTRALIYYAIVQFFIFIFYKKDKKTI